jgi:hypothetical protein
MFTSKHNPQGGATQHCDNERIESLIRTYQANGDQESLAAILSLTERRALTLIRFYKTTRYRPEDELLSDVNFKLLRAVGKFDASKGSAFTYISNVISSTLYTAVSNVRRNASRYVELDEALAGAVPINSQDELGERAAADDLAHRIRMQVKTTLNDEAELSTQRWYVDSFTQDGFEARRHQCANAAMSVYSLSHARSRELYDLTMLEVRRVLYDDIKPKHAIPAGRLLGTRCAWMTRYEPLLTPSEFVKFVTLAKDLSPFVVLLVNPESHSRRRDRNPTIGRQNLEWVLSGHPAAVPLFH